MPSGAMGTGRDHHGHPDLMGGEEEEKKEGLFEREEDNKEDDSFSPSGSKI